MDFFLVSSFYRIRAAYVFPIKMPPDLLDARLTLTKHITIN